MRKKLRVQLGGIPAPTGKPYYEVKPEVQKSVINEAPSLLGGYSSDEGDEQDNVEELLQEVEAKSRALNQVTDGVCEVVRDDEELTERPPGLEVPLVEDAIDEAAPNTNEEVLTVPPAEADPGFDEAEIEAGMESFLNEVANLEEIPEVKEKQKEEPAALPASPSDVLDEISKRIDEKLKKVNAEIAIEDNASDDDKSKKKKRRKRKRDDSDNDEKKRRKKKYRWKQCKDKVSGKYYFWDTVNDKTSWKEPDEPYEAYKDRQARKMREKAKESKSKRKSKSPESLKIDRWEDQNSERGRSIGKETSPVKESIPFYFHGAKKPFYNLLSENMERLKGLKGLLQMKEKFESKQDTMIFTSFSGIKSQLNILKKENPDDMDVVAFQARLGCRLKDWECGALASEYLVMQLGMMSREITALAKSKEEKRRTMEKLEEEKRKAEEDKKDVELIDVKNEQKKEEESEEETGSPLVVQPPPTDVNVKPRIPGTQPYKLIRRLYISHYYEDAKTAATEWESDADTASGWVDHACLVLFVRSVRPKRLKKLSSIQEMLKGMTQMKEERENLLSVQDLGGDYILVEFTSEEAAYEALTKVFKCSIDSPVQAYEAAKEWFPGVNNIFVQFCNKEHLTNAKSLGMEEKALTASEKVDTSRTEELESAEVDSNELPQPTTVVIKPDPLLSTIPVEYAQAYNAYENTNHLMLPEVGFKEEPRRSPCPNHSISYSAPPSTKSTSSKSRKDKERPKKHRLSEQEQIKKAFSGSNPNSPSSKPTTSHRSEPKKAKKKRKKLKGAMGALVDKWKAASKSMEKKAPKENSHNPAAVARQREKKAMRWRLEQKGDVMSNNPNLVPIAKDWKQRLLLEDD